ncbi:MAG: tRNA (adenosine(37)-N6)-dimethylallyltransferase MiaA, partial [Chryseobacterium sp.]
MTDFNLIIILGATASGKTRLAVQVAHALNGEIISADSRQVFKKMDIGTGKDLQEYNFNGQKIPYHLIDILQPGERYHVDAFKNDFYCVFEDILSRGKVPVLCGGTGLYIHSLLQNQRYTAVPVNEMLRAELEKETKEELISRLQKFENTDYVDLNSKKRLIRAIEVAPFLKFNTIETVPRLEERLSGGMIQEVQHLLDEGISKEMLVFYGLEYKFIVNYLSGLLSEDEFKLRLGIAICQYAKRQN